MISNFVKDFLICIEMFLASLGHIWAFPVTPYKADQMHNWWWNIANAANVSDFHGEVQDHYNHFRGRIRQALENRKSGVYSKRSSVVNEVEEPNENTRLLHEQSPSESDKNQELATNYDSNDVSLII